MHSTQAQSTAAFAGAPSEIRSAVQLASADTGVSFSYLMAKAAVESGYRADAKARTSSATGLYQFIERTWLEMVREHGDRHGLGKYAEAIESGRLSKAMRKEILDLRKDPEPAARMAAEFARDNKVHLERTVGGKIGDTELYLAHFLGARGAEKFIAAWRKTPDQIAAQVAPAAAQSNRPVFYGPKGARTLDEVYQRFAAKMGDDGAGGPALAQPTSPSEPRAVATAAAPSGAIRPAAAPGKPWTNISPPAYAAKMFIATLSLPGDGRERG